MGTGPGDFGILDSVRRANYAQDPSGVSLLSDGRDLGLPQATSNNFFSQVPSWSNFGLVNNRDRCPLSSFEDIAYHFCYRYYSLLDGDSASMYSLYSKDGQMSKLDLNGKRVVAVGHGEIRNYYSQFAAIKTSANLTNVEVSCIGANAALLLVSISGTISKTFDGREELYYLSQAVVLSGDPWRSRFHILNDICIEEKMEVSGSFAGQAHQAGGAVGNVEEITSPFLSSGMGLSPTEVGDSGAKQCMSNVNALLTTAGTGGGKRDHKFNINQVDNQLLKSSEHQHRLIAPRVPAGVSEHELTLILSRHVSSIGGLVTVTIKGGNPNAVASATAVSGERNRLAIVTVDSEDAYKMLLNANINVVGRRLHLEPFKPRQQQKDGQHMQQPGKRLGAHSKPGGNNSNTTVTSGAGLTSAGGVGGGRMHAGAGP